MPSSGLGCPRLPRRKRAARGLAFASVLLVVALPACDSSATRTGAPPTSVPVPGTPRADCGRFTVAYDPSNGYEASAYIVGRIAADVLGCSVTYVATSSRAAWRAVAIGRADVYLDAYGSPDLRRRLAGPGGPVTIVGPNGVLGGVDLLAPEFMADRGLRSSRDLADVRRIGWGRTAPSITTIPALLPLARTFVQSQGLDYSVRDYTAEHAGEGTGQLVQQARLDDEHDVPNVYLVAAPRQFLGDGVGRTAVDIPESAAESCRPAPESTLCALTNFRYLRIVNTQFAHSGSPAYTLVYHYYLRRAEAVNVLDIVALSGYDVGPADAAAWINTHRDLWRRWLP
jgi:ABC-type proline/glycine betaine transport system substrate-binding protein